MRHDPIGRKWGNRERGGWREVGNLGEIMQDFIQPKWGKQQLLYFCLMMIKYFKNNLFKKKRKKKKRKIGIRET